MSRLGRILRRSAGRIHEVSIGPAADLLPQSVTDPLSLFVEKPQIGGDATQPLLPVPPAPLGLGDAEQNALERARAEAMARRRKRGRAATVLTGPQGAGLPDVAVKSLLGE